MPKSKSGSTDENEFCTQLEKYHILAVPGTGFGKKEWIRLAYCVSEKTIANSAEAFKAAVKSW